MRELVENDILAVRGIGRAPFHRVPRQHHRAHRARGFAGSMRFAFFPNLSGDWAILVNKIGGWINENRQQPRKVIGLAMQQQQASLRRDRHSNLIGDFLFSAALKIFLRKKYLDVIEQLRLILVRKSNEKRNVAFDGLQPLVRKRPRLQSLSSAVFQEGQHLGTWL